MSTKKLYFLAIPLLLASLLASCTPASPIQPPLAVSGDACSSAIALKDTPLDSAFTSDVILGGGRVQSGDFQFEAYLYCDPILGPDSTAMESRSEIEGLGVHTTWRYEGVDLPGNVELIWGFRQDQPNSGWDGGLTRFSMYTFTGGINSEEITSAIAQGATLQLTNAVKVDGAQVSGAVLSFELVPSSDGYVPENIRLEPLP
jgi:hypothetical protein